MPRARPASELLIRSGPPGSRRVALTFDDGPAETTQELVVTLDRLGAGSTFFLVGSRIEGRGDRIGTILAGAAGHEIGCHSWSHARLAEHPVLAWRELVRARRHLGRLGAPPPRLFRPPYGNVSRSLVRAANLAGMRSVGWNVDPRDWEGRDPGRITAGVLEPVRPGSIVLLHEGANAANMIAALPEMVAGLRKLGLEPVTVGELLGA